MKTSKRFISTLLVGLVITLLTSMAFAQDQDQDSDNANDDPPGRAADTRWATRNAAPRMRARSSSGI